MTNTVIGIFIKYPTPGKVKTRLAKDTSDEFAAKLYSAFVHDICEQLTQWGFPFILIHDPDSSDDMIRSWLPYNVPLLKQRGIDLGERLTNAFHDLYNLNDNVIENNNINNNINSIDNAIIIGSDAPDIPKSHFEEAIHNIQKKCIIGPSKDGGYYMIGMPKALFSASYFECITWSTDTVFNETIDKFNKNKTSYHELPLWYDNDNLEDVKRLYHRLNIHAKSFTILKNYYKRH